MYVLDTNIVIYFFKGMGGVAEEIFSKSPEEIFISAITLHELEVGVAKSDNSPKTKTELDTFVSSIIVLPFTSKEARFSAEIRASLEAQGLPIGPLDNLIAGAALSLNATLVTHHTKEFNRVNGLRIEDWVS